MANKIKATLTGKWWKEYFASILHCYRCGGKLERTYVRVEKTRRHVCVTCQNITYLNPKVVAGVIPVDKKGRVLLLTRAIEPARGYWTFPAGFQEMGETVEEAALREAWEESGARCLKPQLTGLYSYGDAGVVTVVYEAKIKARPVPAPGSEALEIGYFHPKEIPWRRLAFRSTRDALKDWIRARRA